MEIKTRLSALRMRFQTLITFFKWVTVSILVGLLVGGVGTAFSYGVHWGTGFRESHGWIIYCLPVGGAAIALLYRVLGMQQDKGTNLVLAAIHSGERLSIRMMIGIFISTILTHLFGGSAGREGAALQIGGSFSAQLGRFLHMDEKDSIIITMCGMSAGFSALFGTPIASAVFAMEVISVGIMHYSAVVPCLLSALTAQGVARFFGLQGTFYNISSSIPALNIPTTGKVLILAACCALVSILFCVAMHQAAHFLKRLFPNPYLRAAAGGAALVLLTLIFGRDYNGVGESVITLALSSVPVRPEAFLLKIVFTAITLGCGFKGGEIVPSFFVGATLGSLLAGILGLDPAFGAALGMVSVFCGVTNCPMASILLSIEMLGAGGLPFFALSCSVSYMLSGYYGLYAEQKILYSKFRPEYIDRRIGE